MYPYIQDCKKCDFKAIYKIKKWILQFNDNQYMYYILNEILVRNYNKCFIKKVSFVISVDKISLGQFKYLGYTFQIRILHILK